MAMTPNYDYDTEQADILRRQKILDALQTGTLAPIDFHAAPGVRTGGASMLAGVGKVVAAMLGSQQQSALNEQQSNLTSRYKADLQSGTQNFIAGINAKPGEMSPGTRVEGTPDLTGGAASEGNNPSAFVPPTTLDPADARGKQISAVVNAIGSNHPVLQQLGMTQLQNMTRQGMISAKDAADLLKAGWDPHSILNGINGGSLSYLKPGVKTESVNNQLVPVETGTGKVGPVAADLRTKSGPLETVQTNNGPVTAQKDDTGKYEYPPASTNVNVNTQITAAEQAAKSSVEGAFSRLNESMKTAPGLPAQMQSLNAAQQALGDGIKSGIGSDVKMGLARASEALGITGLDPAVANTQQMTSNMANQVLEKIKILRPASDNDVKYAKAASGADASLSIPALQKLIDSGRAAVANAHLQHENLVEKAGKLKGVDPNAVDMYHVPLEYNFDATKFNYNPATMQFTPIGSAGGPDNGPSSPTRSTW